MVKTLTDGLASPWGLAALPGGDLLVSSRDEATITRVDGESGKKTLLGSVPGVAPAGEGVCWASPSHRPTARTT